MPLDRIRTALRFATGDWRRELLRQLAELEGPAFPVQTQKVQRQAANSPALVPNGSSGTGEKPRSGPLSAVAPAAANPAPTPPPPTEPPAPPAPTPVDVQAAPDANWWHQGDRLVELKRRFEAGEPFSSIGPSMGTTKNAAVSAVHRYGIGIRREKAAPPKPPPPGTFADLMPGACAWPIGDPQDSAFHFCGGKTIPGRPYCSSHMAQAFIRPRAPSGWTEERREEAAAAARRRIAGRR